MKNYKMGRLPKKLDPNTLQLATFIKATLPRPKDDCSWYRETMKFPMYLNDQIGCCTISGAGHMRGLWTSLAWGDETILQDSLIESTYETFSGYDPKTGARDNGCAMLDICKGWTSQGILGSQALGFVSVDPSNLDHLKLGLDWFGGLYFGFDMPQSIQDQDFPTVWKPANSSLTGNAKPGSLGGHCVNGVGYYSDGWWNVVSWGEVVRVSADFMAAYLDEAYAILSPDWIMPQFKAPSGLETRELFRQMGLIGR